MIGFYVDGEIQTKKPTQIVQEIHIDGEIQTKKPTQIVQEIHIDGEIQTKKPTQIVQEIHIEGRQTDRVLDKKLERDGKREKCFYLTTHSTHFIYSYMVKNHSDSENGNPLPPHRLLLSINSKGSFICIIPQTG